MEPSLGRRQTKATSEMFGINVPWVIRPGAEIARATYFLRPAAVLWKESPNVRMSPNQNARIRFALVARYQIPNPGSRAWVSLIVWATCAKSCRKEYREEIRRGA